MKLPQFTLSREPQELKVRIKEEICKVIDGGVYTYGPYCQELEEKWARMNDAKYCVLTNSGTAALHLALLSLDLDTFDKVITTPASFIATSEAIAHVNKRIEYVDIDNSCNLDPELLEKCDVNNKTIILPTLLYGNSYNCDKYYKIANERGARIILDGAQATLSMLNHKHLIDYALIVCNSFYPSKTLGAMGEGGCILTNNEEIYKRAKAISSHGQVGKYNHQYLGHNFRMQELTAATLLCKLPYLDKWIIERNNIATLYIRLLTKSVSYIYDWEAQSSVHQFVIFVKDRDKLQQFLKEKGIETVVHYPYAINETSPFNNGKILPKANEWKDACLSLPLFIGITREEIIEVCNRINEFYNN